MSHRIPAFHPARIAGAVGSPLLGPLPARSAPGPAAATSPASSASPISGDRPRPMGPAGMTSFVSALTTGRSRADRTHRAAPMDGAASASSFEVQRIALPSDGLAPGQRVVANVRPVRLQPGGSGPAIIAGSLEGSGSYTDRQGVLHVMTPDGAGGYQRSQRIELPADLLPGVWYHAYDSLVGADTRGDGQSDVFLRFRDKFFRLRNQDGVLSPPEVVEGFGGVMASAVDRITAPDRDQLVVVDGAVKLVSFDDAGEIDSTKVLATLDGTWGPAFDGVVVADLNGNGRKDIFVAGANFALVQDEEGGFVRHDLDMHVPINGTVSAGDIDGDGIPELAITDATAMIDFPGRVRVYRGTPESGYDKIHDGSAWDNHPQSVLLADLTGDDRADLILPGFDSGEVFVQPGREDGKIDPNVTKVHAPESPTAYGGVYYVRALPRADGGADVLTTAKDQIAILRRKAGSTPPPPPPPPGTVDVSLSGSVGKREEKHFVIKVPANGELDVQMTGTGDADVYLRIGASPTANKWDFRPYRGDSNESGKLAVSKDDVVYGMVRGYAGHSTFDLQVKSAE